MTIAPASKQKVMRMAIALPQRSLWDYLPPENAIDKKLEPGMRFWLPFGRRFVMGILVELAEVTDIPLNKLKQADHCLDDQAFLPQETMTLCLWVSQYYHHPVGEVLLRVLPKWLRENRPGGSIISKAYALTAAGRQAFPIKRSPRATALLQLIHDTARPMTKDEIKQRGFQTDTVRRLLKKGWLQEEEFSLQRGAYQFHKPGYDLSAEQEHAVSSIMSHQSYQCFLLQGVTGSGKTEVYMQCMDKIIQRGEQVLFLLPEIALAHAVYSRIKSRFQARVACLHSGLKDSERALIWLQAQKGEIDIVVGTRSCVFMPMRCLGLIVVDEEHDTSYAQHTSLRYSGRDCAVRRAQIHNIPVILGSATPSMESLLNVKRQRYQLLTLNKRLSCDALPIIHLIDKQNASWGDLVNPDVLAKIKKSLQKGRQVLFFVNRRGFAPRCMCNSCGWVASCRQCDANMTVHYCPPRLCCHHCGCFKSLPQECADCHKQDLQHVGMGTERMAAYLADELSGHSLVRIDRDQVANTKTWPALLQDITDGKYSIIVATQMLAKGHHFPLLSDVVVVDADDGFYGSDFRSLERMAQLTIQVAGRAGREEQGHVYLQTKNPQHPVLQALKTSDYNSLSQYILKEREQAALPPFSYWALLQVEAKFASKAETILKRLMAKTAVESGIKILGPMPAIMERKQGWHRYQLIIQSLSRKELHKYLGVVTFHMEELTKKQGMLRWFLDIDPAQY